MSSADLPVREQELVERALAASRAESTIVLVERTSTVNLRWAGNTLTTNGTSDGWRVAVVATTGVATGTAAGVVGANGIGLEDVQELADRALTAATQAGSDESAGTLVPPGEPDPTWDDPSPTTGAQRFGTLAPALADRFAAARGDGRLLYGFAEHEITTTYLGTSTGLRRRHVQPTGRLELTAKIADGNRSTWAGVHTRDFDDVDLAGLDARLARQLDWAARQVDRPAGRYPVVLPAGAVADLMVYLYWSAQAQEALDGRSVFSRPGGGTRVGEQLSSLPLRLSSDPAYPGLECAPFAIELASGPGSSVFDNGLVLSPTHWVDDGRLAALRQSRHTAALTGLPVTPGIDNLVMSLPGATGGLDDLVAATDHGLLLTCLWYIREVDPQRLLLTGLTRDGVYVIEGGEVVGSTNNFRFNDSPVELLARVEAATATHPGLPREWADDFPRVAGPALRVADFTMSSVSPAS
ncbi:MAG: metallopeptidase TldD-related protein [Actinomycetes bacterium]